MMVDVTDSISVQGMVDAAIKAFGKIEYSVNSEGARALLELKALVQNIVRP